MPDHHSTMSTNRTFTLSISASFDTVWFYLRLPQLFSCVAFSLVASMGTGREDLCNMEYKLPVKLVHTLLIVLLYTSALVLWPLYQFYERLDGKPQRSSDEDCIDGFTACLCTWDQRLAVAILTASNLLVYVAGLVYWACQLSVGTKRLHSTPDSLRS
ncbi:hypothetical protein R6Z07M_015489 [Ovis aries]